jgi:hypothetical protein
MKTWHNMHRRDYGTKHWPSAVRTRDSLQEERHNKLIRKMSLIVILCYTWRDQKYILNTGFHYYKTPTRTGHILVFYHHSHVAVCIRGSKPLALLQACTKIIVHQASPVLPMYLHDMLLKHGDLTQIIYLYTASNLLTNPTRLISVDVQIMKCTSYHELILLYT